MTSKSPNPAGGTCPRPARTANACQPAPVRRGLPGYGGGKLAGTAKRNPGMRGKTDRESGRAWPITPQRPAAVPAALRRDRPAALRRDQPAALRRDRPAALRRDQPAALRHDQPRHRWRGHCRLWPEGAPQATDPCSFQHLGHHPIGDQWLARRSRAPAPWSSSWRKRLAWEWPPALTSISGIAGGARCACPLRGQMCPAISVRKHALVKGHGRAPGARKPTSAWLRMGALPADLSLIDKFGINFLSGTGERGGTRSRPAPRYAWGACRLRTGGAGPRRMASALLWPDSRTACAMRGGRS